ncbi:M56 family metallopeptidase [Flavobacterium franklandianum]|uniref:M56 family metallopeptidase n=1 Tax=Flavobacterium franklandianum TaxID=2594430 RepID=A0A553CMK0_9FLAO|nr:M56 family metallopeptidase [Flavobacterium franklandianum]TRX21681.1 M56 family metallopeptidase [Flavobacterium franklandianum]
METLFIYLFKSSGLIGLFYLSYHILLRKETFFNSNRWFLLAGLITSVELPLVVFTKIVWVDPSPTTIDWSNIPMTTPVENEAFEINWYLVLAIVYSIGILAFLVKFAFDFFSLSMILKGKTIQHQADFKFIDVSENVSPFSYFNSIVYNSSLYSETELENILEHEKVHSAQNHTIDVLISRLFCVVFWFNPIVWLYKNAIAQNLEFIADSEASKTISDKKAYQLTLLKITTQENCVAITNHFYQSLIKKRIVMLNKNQSNKRNSWKYALILPILGAFVFFFQVKVVAQEKEPELTTIDHVKSIENAVDVYKINKNTTDAELKEKTKALKENYAIIATFSSMERNSENELIAIKVNLKKGKDISKKMATKGTEAIKTFGIIVSKNINGELSADFGTDDRAVINQKSVLISPNAPLVFTEKEIFIDGAKVSQEDLDKLDPNEIESIDVNKKSDIGTIRVVTKKFSKTINENDIYINDEKVDKNELLLLDQNTIQKMDVNKTGKTIRITTKTIHQSADNIDIPSPPTPPTPPAFTLKNPKPPVFPKAPKAPKGDPINGDKKAWKEFEIKMEDFNKKMEALEPQMKEFDKQMEEFDKQMEPFNTAMEAFEKKMKTYELQMEEYETKMKAQIGK